MNRVGILVSGWLGAILWLLLGRQVTQLAAGAAPLSLVNVALLCVTVGAAFLLGLWQAWLVLTWRGPSVKEGSTAQPSVVPSAAASNAPPQDWQRDDIRGLTSSLDRLYSHFAADPTARAQVQLVAQALVARRYGGADQPPSSATASTPLSPAAAVELLREAPHE